MWTGAGSGLLISMLEKLKKIGAIDAKMDGSVLVGKSSFKMLAWNTVVTSGLMPLAATWNC